MLRGRAAVGSEGREGPDFMLEDWPPLVLSTSAVKSSKAELVLSKPPLTTVSGCFIDNVQEGSCLISFSSCPGCPCALGSSPELEPQEVNTLRNIHTHTHKRFHFYLSHLYVRDRECMSFEYRAMVARRH